MITLRSERVIKGQAKESRLVDGGGGGVKSFENIWGMVPRGYKCHATSPLHQNWSFIKITTTLHYGRLFSMLNFFSVIDLIDSNLF